jgi:multidrug efflux pump subunit AcrA (membrane-fusion protein)
MERFPPGSDPADLNGHGHDEEEWAEALARSVAHLAAQLTISQIRLRALATELGERALLQPSAVAERVREIAVAETGAYLRENLGDSLIEIIDVEALERDLVDYLNDEGETDSP